MYYYHYYCDIIFHYLKLYFKCFLHSIWIVFLIILLFIGIKITLILLLILNGIFEREKKRSLLICRSILIIIFNKIFFEIQLSWWGILEGSSMLSLLWVIVLFNGRLLLLSRKYLYNRNIDQ